MPIRFIMFYLCIYLFIYDSDRITLKLLHTLCVKKQTCYIYSLMQYKFPLFTFLKVGCAFKELTWWTEVNQAYLDVARCSYIIYLLDAYVRSLCDSDSYIANVISQETASENTE
jgi:hypothetical protein